MCNCGNNSSILSSTATTAVSSSQLLITPSNTLTPNNEQGVKILIKNSTAAAGMALPVFIELGGTAVPVCDKFGNLVYGTQIYKGQILKGYYGNNGIGANAHYQLIRLPRRYYYGGGNQ